MVVLVSYVIQLKLLNVITSGQMETDTINWMISSFTQKCIENGTYEIWLQKAAVDNDIDHIKQLNVIIENFIIYLMWSTWSKRVIW